LLRLVPQAGHEIRNGQWRQLQGRQLTRRTVGIIGCGHVGKDLAGLLKAFDCRVLAHDILDFPDFYSASGVIPVSLDQLLAEAEIVTLHLPKNASTHNILSRRRLQQMRKGAVVINTARGGLIDEEALKELLISGHIAGAGLDVLAQEPPINCELLSLLNVLVTPHIGGSSEEAVLAMGRAAIAGLASSA
jgi:phosphoglycerate dehydrogenase-like enzyme